MSSDVGGIYCKGKLYTGRTLCRTNCKMQHCYSKMSVDAFRFFILHAYFPSSHTNRAFCTAIGVLSFLGSLGLITLAFCWRRGSVKAKVGLQSL